MLKQVICSDCEDYKQNIKDLLEDFDNICSLVILHSPEIWEYYLEDRKAKQLA